MKKIIILILFLMLTTSAFAQQDKMYQDTLKSASLTKTKTFERLYTYVELSIRTDTVALFDSVTVWGIANGKDTVQLGVRSLLTYNDASIITFPVTKTWYKFLILDPAIDRVMIKLSNTVVGTTRILPFILIGKEPK